MLASFYGAAFVSDHYTNVGGRSISLLAHSRARLLLKLADYLEDDL